MTRPGSDRIIAELLEKAARCRRRAAEVEARGYPMESQMSQARRNHQRKTLLADANYYERLAEIGGKEL